MEETARHSGGCAVSLKFDIERWTAVVSDAVGLTQGEREAVYEAVIDLVEARLKKAESV